MVFHTLVRTPVSDLEFFAYQVVSLCLMEGFVSFPHEVEANFHFTGFLWFLFMKCLLKYFTTLLYSWIFVSFVSLSSLLILGFPYIVSFVNL